MRARRFALLFAGFVLLSAFANASDKPWIEIRSPHFRILTDGSEKDGRRVAREFEQMRYVFSAWFEHFRLDSGAPLTIFAVRNENSAKELAPAQWKNKGVSFAGFYQQSWEKQYAIVRLDEDTPGAFQTVYHEYAHSIIHMNLHWIPTWLDEGLAEFFGYTHFERNQILLGFPSYRIDALRYHGLFPIDTVLSVNPYSPYYREEDKVQAFYGESWLLIHYMEFGQGMERGAKLNQFITLLDQGMDQKKAFTQIFGDTRKMYDTLSYYLSSPTLPDYVFHNPPKFPDDEFTTRTLTMAETNAELGGYHAYSHDNDAARSLLEQSIKDDPKLGLAHEYMGMLDFNQGKDSDAVNEFEQAYKLDSALYLSLFFKTMMSPEARPDYTGDRDDMYAALLTVLKLRPDFAPAYAQLSFYHLRNGNMMNALVMAKKAQQAEPSRAGYYNLIAHILVLMGKYEDAIGVIDYVAPRWISSDHNEAVEIWNTIPAAKRPASETFTFSYPENTDHVEGILQSITCGDKEKGIKFELVLEHSGQSLKFYTTVGVAAGFTDTLWYGEDHLQICHHLEGKRIIAIYKPSKQDGFAGDLNSIEIRVDPPMPPPIKTTADAASAQP